MEEFREKLEQHIKVIDDSNENYMRVMDDKINWYLEQRVAPLMESNLKTIDMKME